MCQAEKTTKKKFLFDLNNPVTTCNLDNLIKKVLFLVANHGGYHDGSTACSCKNKQNSNGLIQLPFALGEISKIYPGSGVEECLANIDKLLHALICKGGKRIPMATITELIDARCTFLKFRAFIWADLLISGSTENAEDKFEIYSHDQLRHDKFRDLLNSDSVPEVWGRAVRHQIDSLVEMMG